MEFIYIVTLFVITTIILVIASSLSNKKTNENIVELWNKKGYETNIKEEISLGIFKSKNIVAKKKIGNITIVGTNWTEHSGKSTIPYWGIAIFLNNENLIPFSIIRRKPTILDWGRLKLDDEELDKSFVIHCKNNEWFQSNFDYLKLLKLKELLPKNTKLYYEEVVPHYFLLNMEKILPAIIIQRKENIYRTKYFDKINNFVNFFTKKRNFDII